MNFYDKFTGLFKRNQKHSIAREASSINILGEPVYTPANYGNFANQGYKKNAIVFMAISKITTACKGVDWILYQKKSGRRLNWKELENHPILDLWEKPNPMQSRGDFVESVIGFKKIAGNSYIEANKLAGDSIPRELWPVRPDRMKVYPGRLGYPSKYEFSNGDVKRYWEVDPVKLTSNILHMKYFHPYNDWYGMSPLETALASVDQFNAGQKWNLALLQNEARPSGILQMKITDANPSGRLTDEQFSSLKAEWNDTYGGYKNAGRPAIIEGGLEWKSIALSPKDMDFLKLKEVTASDIALVYGVPPEIVGLGTKTFANYKEARLAFYEETVLPTLDNLRDAINRWLLPEEDNLFLDYDRDTIDALVEKREQKYTTLQTSSFLTENEKRVSAGYEEVEGMDIFVIGGAMYHKDEFKLIAEEALKPPEEEPPPPEEEPPPPEEDPEEETDDGKSFKSFNLFTRNEKLKSWKRQNKLRDKYANQFRKEVTRDFQSLSKKLQKAADEIIASGSSAPQYGLMKTVTEWVPELEKTMERNIGIVINDFGDTVLKEGKSLGLGIEYKTARSQFDSFVLEYIKSRTGTQIVTITNTTEKRIKRIVSEWVAEAQISGDTLPELSKYLEAEFEGLTKTNAMRIARTETAAASTNGSLEAVKSMQIPGMVKEWVSAQDDRVRQDPSIADHSTVNANNGQIPVDDDFDVEPDILMKGPHDPAAPAEQVINCRCSLTFQNRSTEGEV